MMISPATKFVSSLIFKAASLQAECLNLRASFHTSAALQYKIKRAPQSKSDLPSSKSSLGKLVSRGMIVKDQPKEYTAKPIKVTKTGGRGIDGRIEIRRIGGGKPVMWHMADLVRITEKDSSLKVEVIKDIIDEQTRSAYLALVIGGERKRWIIATDNMKVGDLIKSTRRLPVMPIQGQPGDAHPVGALPIGTQICCVEKKPYAGSTVANGAGTSATIIKKNNNLVTIKMPSKHEMIVNEKCMCVVGRVSNPERNKVDLRKAGASRWLGIRPKSGLWLRKTGLAGRKIKPMPKPINYTSPKRMKPIEVTPVQTFTDRCQSSHVYKQRSTVRMKSRDIVR